MSPEAPRVHIDSERGVMTFELDSRRVPQCPPGSNVEALRVYWLESRMPDEFGLEQGEQAARMTRQERRALWSVKRRERKHGRVLMGCKKGKGKGK